MANEVVYKITVAEKLVNLFKDAFGDAFRLYRVGDPIIPGQSELPAIFVTETQLQILQDATGYDGLKHTITIQLVFNKKDEMGRPVEGNTLDTILDNYIYGRDPSTNEYSPDSIMGVLRTNFTLDNMTIQTEAIVRKELVVRPEDALTAEASIIIEVHELQAVNNRT